MSSPWRFGKKGTSNKDVAVKYDLPRNTLSTWVKNKEKLLDSLEKGSNIKWTKLRTVSFELIDKAIFNWFLSIQSPNFPLSITMIQEMALTFTKELNIENLQTSDGWLQR